MAGYHPTAKEAKTLLKETAIPVPSWKKGNNGYGMVNAYKLAMIGKRLKEQCRQDISCFKQKINDPQNYHFKLDDALLPEVRKAFPQCDRTCVGLSPSCSGRNCPNREKICSNKKNIFNKLRKAAFLRPSDKKLWRHIACIYKSADFTMDAKGVFATYKSISPPRKNNNYLLCDSDSECTLVPVPLRGCYIGNLNAEQLNFDSQWEITLLPINKQSAEDYYFSCRENPKCNGKCRCNKIETIKKQPIISMSDEVKF